MSCGHLVLQARVCRAWLRIITSARELYGFAVGADTIKAARCRACASPTAPTVPQDAVEQILVQSRSGPGGLHESCGLHPRLRSGLSQAREARVWSPAFRALCPNEPSVPADPACIS